VRPAKYDWNQLSAEFVTAKRHYVIVCVLCIDVYSYEKNGFN